MSRQATVRLTMAQALVRHLAALRVAEEDGTLVPYVGGVWAIFGHGNVAGLGEALAQTRDALPVYRAHNEQAMAHAAIAYGKAHFRRRIMAATSSIGPGATNMVTAAALAHAGRLPVLLLPGDTFASRAPDPVLQQLESFAEGDATANDAFRPVSRYFDRIVRPEQILTALPRAIQVLTDPAQCGPVTLALPQDVQTLAFDCPEDFLQPEPIRIRRPQPDPVELARAIDALRRARRPLIVAGGGVLYSLAGPTLADFAERHGVPVAESQAGKGALSWRHPLNLGAIGVTGSPAANAAAAQADLVIGVGTRLQDFTTGSHSLFGQARLLSVNVQPFDAHKRGGQALVADARDALDCLGAALADWRADASWTGQACALARDWNARVDTLTTAAPEGLPYDAHVIGAVRDSAADSPGGDIVVCAAGTLPAELHKLWRSGRPGNYHMDYGYSCMGYEIAGGLGVKLARPEREVIVMVGDGSYLMMNSEIATAVMLGKKLIIVVLDNRGFGCINRLQRACGGENYNNLLEHCVPEGGEPVRIDFAAHAASLGADAVHVDGLNGLRAAMLRARAGRRTSVIVIDTTPEQTTSDGGWWWEVAVPEVSPRADVGAAYQAYRQNKTLQRV
ncbi:3D-(3,5/4)-trihydroxycyclohexane-1,2-dione acylhydrolase (decyclizing) [Ralstonia solanacearum]|uniref:3D-(3,5/4)-trihydroxycyclohexane-1,2-dione acylhydrolase (decyclizing) n=1 Tax=Ralstonia solanacearum TaxID=305 RepID=UPI0005ABED3F|nr:3D-(3,5/4)-trihydroxycyclohexane-1,2-dione acylhydrolase (decyclizing) [Ralstonia solanacearum]ATJ86267.1 3D-(3,5/4)-trihydroxycyclohexane-1,2-dione acylhydrolase (decyclizing) [Ralstonia solanacearum]AYB51825.1 3D-(3,5/4)-trihydroxycyclohexane-1,2-dione acylhydrolase (decyclizing) [Ralstonia solanacearum]AYB56379.1 3D-(3,5/4)-trihydroxycyclohexane-1,2-dione acylhydrolase (decyclizing) [Ralstonia solanacearum]RCW12044.1 3D-(3,5/4)-trihydroxycyclohexane-1,2-dione acylhydrolase (decyclizing) [